MAGLPRVAFVHMGEPSTFVARDRHLLERSFDVEPVRYDGAADGVRVARAAAGADAVLAWFADWHAAFAVGGARLGRAPSVVVVGGYDAASEPEIGYGMFHQADRPRRAAARFALRRATRLLPVSEFTRRSLARNVPGHAPADVVYNGVDPGEFPMGPREREPVVLTVTHLTEERIRVKGIPTFLGAAERLTGVRFRVVGALQDDAAERLRGEAPSNVTFAGRLSSEELRREFQEASVYCQLSYHESFGVALVESMLSGCVPVVTTQGALPEVVGEVGYRVPYGDVEATVSAVENALGSSRGERERARERVEERFTLQVRGEHLRSIVESVL